MISIYKWVWASAMGLACIRPLHAQETNGNSGQAVIIAQQLIGLQHTLSAQKSLSLVARESGHVEPGFGQDAAPDFAATLKLSYKGDRFLYDYEFVGPKGPISSAVESFDGSRFARLDRRGRVLTISSRPFVNDVVMCQGHVFFMPFLFLQSGFRDNAFAQLSYAQLTRRDDWMNALASNGTSLTIEDVSLEGRQFWKISNLGLSADSASGEVTVFDVYFSKEFPWYPLRWDRRLPVGNRVSSYSVEELGFIPSANGEKVPYPKIAVLKHYRDGKLRDTERIEVQQISFDSVRDDQFTLDQASADYLRDLDNGGKRVRVLK